MTAPLGRERPWLWGEGWPVAALALLKLLIHAWTGLRYGYFVDELYYLACSTHLAWGYVDQPPLIAFLAHAERALLGDSLAAIRVLPILAGSLKVVLTGLLARELGGRRTAQTIAALCALTAPGFFAIDNWLSMNAFEPLFWTGCALFVARIIREGRPAYWLWFGILAGVGMENKYSMLIFGAGLIAGLLATPERRILRTPWVWAGAAIALAIFAPNLAWNFAHHFPFLDLQANIRASGRNVPLPPLTFLAQETVAMLPLSLPVWLAGLWFYFRAPSGRRFRALGWAWIATAAVIITANPRTYYLFPAFPILFSAGAVMWEAWIAQCIAQRRSLPSRTVWRWWIGTYAVLWIAAAALALPLAVPALPVEAYIRYASFLHVEQPRIETAELGPLPQLFADQFGWKEMTAAVAEVYWRLPPGVRPRTAIFAQNYGQAGAIDFFGPHYGIPKAISGHQSYCLWGPGVYTGESVIVLDGALRTLEKQFEHVRVAGRVEHPYSMPYEHFNIYYCTGLRVPLKDLWPAVKHWN